jgi:large subunit ribosomal protein L24
MSKRTNQQPKLHIKKGDKVQVLTGNDKGKTGEVLEIITDKQKALVKDVNVKFKHEKPSATSPQGGINKKEAPIHISNLMLIDPATGEATKVGRKQDENGKLQRYSKKTGEIIK